MSAVSPTTLDRLRGYGTALAAILRRISLAGALVLALAILTSIGWLVHAELAAFAEADRRVDYTYRVIGEFDGLLSAVQDAEMGERGVLIVGEPPYLQPYSDAVSAVDARLQALRSLTADSPRQQQRLAALQPLIEQRLAIIRQTIELRSTSGLEAAAAVVYSGRGKALTDQVRAIVASAQAEERRLLDQRAADRAVRDRRLTQVLVGGGLLAATLLTTVIVVLWRENGRRKRAEEQLRLLAGALQSAANGIALTDVQGTIIWANPSFCGMAGYACDELLGQNHRILQSGEQGEAFYRNLWETILRGEIWRGELVNRRKDGSTYSEEQTITPLKDAQGRITHFVSIKQDISTRKAVEQALAAAKLSADRATAAAEQASQAKDHFLAVLSHELRNPLTPVLATAAALEREQHLGTELREHLEVIRRNAELEARLIDDLLDVTRITRGKIELFRERTELCVVIERAIEVCRPDIEARGIHFGVDWGQRPYWVDADMGRLQQVFWNLLKNAIKFTPSGGCVGVKCRRVKSHVVAEVIDSGIGISPEMLPAIFNAFEQVERTITRQFGGLGLGLTISKAMVDLHGGTIEAHSEGKDKGAVFRVRLPLKAPADLPPSPARPRTNDQRPMTSLRILVVEDHGDTARIMQRFLRLEGHEVETAGDVATAIQKLSTNDFGLLISDLGLPDGTGLDLMRTLREHGRNTPGIALSGYGQEEDIRRSREVGFAAHLTKPANPDQLLAAIATVVHARDAH